MQYTTSMAQSQKQNAASSAAATQGKQASTSAPQIPVVPPPSHDPEHIELYYKVRDDLKEQIAAADTRAIATLTLELAFVAGATTLIPLIVAHLSVRTRHRSAPPPAFPPLLWLEIAIDVLFWAGLLLAVLWLAMSTLSIWLTMTDVLRAEFREPPMSKRKLLAILTGGAFEQKALQGAPALDRNGTRLPFSPYALASTHNLLGEMRALDISDALVEDIKTKAAIAQDKRLRIQEGTRSFTIQVGTLLILLVISLVLPYIS